jgi:HEAT repeat protein
VARRVVPESPLVGALAHRVLLDALDGAGDPDDSIAALAGLGNEGNDDSLDSLLAYVDHQDFGVRLQVASALRNQTDERARAALFELLQDEDDAVARVALGSLADHRLGGDAASSLAAVGLAGAFNPAIVGALVGELGRRVDEGPEVRQALARLGDTSEDARLRARVDAVLAL